MIEIYTDGSYSSSRNQGGWAYVVKDSNERKYFSFAGVLDTTNNRMEIQGAIEALKYCHLNNIHSVTVYTDSMYVIGTMTKNWKRNANVDLWIILDNLKQNLNIDWKHVKGHNGDPDNEYCDMLAVHGSQLKLSEC